MDQNQQLESAAIQLERLRTQIDLIDNTILKLFQQRMLVSDSIGILKRDHKVPIVQNNRFEHLAQSLVSAAAEVSISEEFMLTYLNALHKESIRRQKAIMETEKKE